MSVMSPGNVSIRHCTCSGRSSLPSKILLSSLVLARSRASVISYPGSTLISLFGAILPSSTRWVSPSGASLRTWNARPVTLITRTAEWRASPSTRVRAAITPSFLTLPNHTGKTFYRLALRPLTGPMRIPELTVMLQNPKVQYSPGSIPTLGAIPLPRKGLLT